jgi:hypothetical protein
MHGVIFCLITERDFDVVDSFVKYLIRIRLSVKMYSCVPVTIEYVSQHLYLITAV